MNQLMYHCKIYMKTDGDEELKEAADRLERILDDCGLDYDCEGLFLYDEEGNELDGEGE